MKKFFIAAAFIFTAVIFSACSFNIEGKVKSNLSEASRVLFIGENQNFKVSFESGTREDPYEFNGRSEAKRDFGVVKVIFNEKYNDSKAAFTLMKGDTSFTGELEENPFDGSFMADVQELFVEDDVLSLDVNGEVVNLTCVSSEFAIDFDEAIKIAIKEMKETFDSYSTAGGLNAECYVKIINNQKNGFNDYFWYFSVYGADSKTHVCVISVETGEVLSRR